MIDQGGRADRFPGSPSVLAAGDGWEELSYLDGEVAADPAWQPGRGPRLPPYARTDAARAAAGRLIRALPSTSAGLEPPVPATGSTRTRRCPAS